jgi:signal transduction histidine kinase
MTSGDPNGLTVDALRGNALFAALGHDELEWLTTVGRLRTLVDGEVIFAEGARATDLVVLLDGEIVITHQVDGRDEVLTRHSTHEDADQHENKPDAAHRFTGEMPLLADGEYIATASAVGSTRVALFSRDAFMAMLVRCPQVNQVLLPVLAWRIHSSEVQAGHRAKVNALGTLAAGIAHELNNPAAAIARSADDLSGALSGLESAAESWAIVADPEEAQALAKAAVELRALPVRLTGRDALDDADAEDEALDWLDAQGVEAEDLVGLLVERGQGKDWLVKLAEGVRRDHLGPALELLARSLTTHSLVSDISDAGRRISAIVSATKDYTNLDRAPEQEFDVNQGLETTLTMLRPKLRGVGIQRDYGSDVPRVIGYPTELNQVWTNLIDNAVDAMDGSGTLSVTTRLDGNCVLVEIADSGPGIPPDIQENIFEPFFTTKDVGKGTGLGLHLSHRIVTIRHHGSLTVRSQPGRTRFLVRIPSSPNSDTPCAIPQFT